MTINDVESLNQQLAQRTGLSLGLLQRPAVAMFVKRRCAVLGLANELAYFQLLMRDSAETERLVEEVAVPETWFFRYPASFELLIDRCGGLLRDGQGKLRMLSVACATGEEPYSMMMSACQAGWPLDRVTIAAIDRHEASLRIARAACYGNHSFRESMPPWANQWFRKGSDGMRVDPRLASRVTFSSQDVLSGDWNVGSQTFDFIFCRNLLIYLSDPARTKLAELLLSALSPSGLLFVGHAEQPILTSESLESAGVKWTYALRRRASLPAAILPTRVMGKPVVTPAAGKNRVATVTPAHKPGPPLPATESLAASASLLATEQPTLPLRSAAAGSDPDATVQQARGLANAGRLDEALAVLQSIQSLHSAGPDFFELLGNVQLGLGRLNEARDAFSKVLYFQPDHEASLLQLGIIFDRFGNADQASRFRRRANRAHDQQQRQLSEGNE